jgi:hypothetical protein
MYSAPLFYTPPTQDPVAPLKRIAVGRTAGLQLCLCPCLTPARKNQVNSAWGADKGAISPLTSPLPSGSLSYPPPDQDPVNPPRRVVGGRAATLRLCLCPCLTPASKNRVQPSSGCRQGGDITTNLATAPCLSFLPATHPRPRCSTKTNHRRPHGKVTAWSLSMPNACKKKSGSTELGVPTRGRYHP